MPKPVLTVITPQGLSPVTVDATISHDFSDEADVTEHKVETGANVADHVRKRPVIYKMQGVITETPLGDGGVLDQTLSQAAYNTLLQVQLNGIPCSIVTAVPRPESPLQNMVLQALGVTKTKETGRALSFSATWKQIIFVNTQVVKVQTNTPRARTSLNSGKKTAAPATVTDQKASTGYQLFHSFFGGG